MGCVLLAWVRIQQSLRGQGVQRPASVTEAQSLIVKVASRSPLWKTTELWLNISLPSVHCAVFGELALVDPGVHETYLGSLLTKQKVEFPALFPEVASSDGAVLSGGSGVGESAHGMGTPTERCHSVLPGRGCCPVWEVSVRGSTQGVRTSGSRGLCGLPGAFSKPS